MDIPGWPGREGRDFASDQVSPCPAVGAELGVRVVHVGLDGVGEMLSYANSVAKIQVAIDAIKSVLG
jgi:hypothetical protein